MFKTSQELFPCIMFRKCQCNSVRFLKQGFGPPEPRKSRSHFACRLLLFSCDIGQAADDSVEGMEILLFLETNLSISLHLI